MSDDELAVDVADRVLDHLRTMYPDALKAVPKAAQTSLRNITISAASAAVVAAKAEEREACLNEISMIAGTPIQPQSALAHAYAAIRSRA